MRGFAVAAVEGVDAEDDSAVAAAVVAVCAADLALFAFAVEHLCLEERRKL